MTRYTFERGVYPQETQIDARELDSDLAARIHAQRIAATTIWDVGGADDQAPRRVPADPVEPLVEVAWMALGGAT